MQKTHKMLAVCEKYQKFITFAKLKDQFFSKSFIYFVNNFELTENCKHSIQIIYYLTEKNVHHFHNISKNIMSAKKVKFQIRKNNFQSKKCQNEISKKTTFEQTDRKINSKIDDVITRKPVTSSLVT